MTDSDDSSTITRRTLLGASGGALALSFAGSASAEGNDRPAFRRCPDATIRPEHRPCAGASMDGCADDHPETEALREAVAETLEDRYPTVGALIDDGFLPYFDTLDGDDDAYSHWLSPEYIGDDHTLDPDRPESVLVDNETWRAIGVMFIATDRGEPIERPPVVYGDRDDLEVDDDHFHDHDDDHHHGDHHDDYHHADEDYCAPWHTHVGLPGRFGWWYYRQVYEGDYQDGEVLLPCETPCMMHVWTVPHPDSVYAHDPPPRDERDDAPAEAGFDTDAEPGEDDLGWDALPDGLEPDVKPEDLSPFDR